MRLVLGFLIWIVVGAGLQAQVRAGLKGGLSTIDIPASPVIIQSENGSPISQMSIEDAKIGLHLGFFMLGNFGIFTVQPEFLINTQTVDFRFTDLQGNEPDQFRDEVYTTLDFPLLVGFNFGPVRIIGGPAGHLFLNSNSDLQDFAGYEQDFDTVTWGWQAGIGLDIWKLHLDARYEGNFTNFGSHMVFNGESYEFDASPSRYLFSIGISF